MKKIIAVALALMLAAAFVPGALAQPKAQGTSVTYTGGTTDASNVQVGNTFNWTLSISEASSLYSGQWLVDYPEEYLTPTSSKTIWSGSLISITEAAWEEGNSTSDKVSVTCNLTYTGQSGETPVGEAGNMYNNIGMSLTTFQHWGVQLGAPFIRITYRIDQLPPRNMTEYDEGGHYLVMPVIVVSSNYYVEGSTIAPGNDYCRPHENVTAVNGKVYIGTTEPTNIYTVNFYGYNNTLLSSQQIAAGGSAVAPNVEALVVDAAGPHRFFAWDKDFSSITADLDVHAEYVLVGDVNLNGEVAADDALLALRQSMGIADLPAKNIFAGDVNQDNSLSAEDALIILRFTMGIVTALA